QTQLVQSGKLASIGELAAGVAHELNQPLMIIRITAQLMLRKQTKNALDTAKLSQNLNSIEKNTKRMMNIIDHLRTFSRQTKNEFTLVNVNEIIQGSFLMIGEQLSLRNIEVIKDFSGDIPKVLGDANQLEQVFLNLLANARDAIESKFEARGGGAELQKKIVITTHVSGDGKDTVEILFKDTGSGIPQETLENIFDPFYTTKEVGKGTGLGLSITYGIIQDHKGKVDVLETGPGGTTFRIRLPAA
ncbi:MAG: ATP-binding protein, partial [Desulfatiglandaceae bacterium]